MTNQQKKIWIEMQEALESLIDSSSGEFWVEYDKVLHAKDKKKIIKAIKNAKLENENLKYNNSEP